MEEELPTLQKLIIQTLRKQVTIEKEDFFKVSHKLFTQRQFMHSEGGHPTQKEPRQDSDKFLNPELLIDHHKFLGKIVYDSNEKELINAFEKSYREYYFKKHSNDKEKVLETFFKSAIDKVKNITVVEMYTTKDQIKTRQKEIEDIRKTNNESKKTKTKKWLNFIGGLAIGALAYTGITNIDLNKTTNNQDQNINMQKQNQEKTDKTYKVIIAEEPSQTYNKSQQIKSNQKEETTKNIKYEETQQTQPQDKTRKNTQFNITLKIQEVNAQEIMRLARSQGITGVLRAISDETPNYEEGGNIHQLANAIGINLYEENQDLEKKAGIPQNLIGNGINDILLAQDVKFGIEFLEQYLKQNQKPIASGKKLNPEDYQEIAKTYNQTNIPSAIKKISTQHDLDTQQTIDAIIESREYAGVTSIRYTQILEKEITKQDSQFILTTYLENKVKDAKKIINNYLQEYKDMHVNNIYTIIDTASKKVGTRKIRKKGKTNQQKQQLTQQIKQYT